MLPREGTFGANPVRLSGREWLVVLVVMVLVIRLFPDGWARWESVAYGKNYRVPYALSKDYWLYERWLGEATSEDTVFVVGDSVVWGEYVRVDGTLSAFLNKMSDVPSRFVNAGLNGLFPLALEGLVRCYGGSIRDRAVLLHCNLLWMTSREADLSGAKEQRFNHPHLVPQFDPEIPSYRATLEERLEVVMGRSVRFLGFVSHLQNAYLDQKGFYEWTLADDGDYPPSYPHTYQLPWMVIDGVVSGEPQVDPDRGVNSDRHRSWSSTGVGSQHFDWIPLDTSLQWAAFQRLVRLLRDRGNHLLVVVGPLNRHIMSPENQTVFDDRSQSVVDWFEGERVPCLVPETLRFDLYGDASHPLTEGYEKLAASLWDSEAFQTWLQTSSSE